MWVNELGVKGEVKMAKIGDKVDKLVCMWVNELGVKGE